MRLTKPADEADEGDEQADADADGLLEGLRDGVHDGLAQTGDHQDADEQALQDHQAHRVLPAHQGSDLEGDDGVDAEAGGQGERQVAGDAHDDRHDRGHQRGGGGELDGVEGVPVHVLGAAQDDRVEDEDVGHREERGETAADLTGEGGAPFGDLEEPVEGVGAGLGDGSVLRRLGLLRSGHAWLSSWLRG
jgi:hypothetical protein